MESLLNLIWMLLDRVEKRVCKENQSWKTPFRKPWRPKTMDDLSEITGKNINCTPVFY